MRSLTTYLLLATAFIAAIAGSSCRTRQKTPTVTARATVQEIEFSDEKLLIGIKDTLQFGTMRRGEVVAKSLSIKNCNARPIVLLRYATSCGCVRINYDRKPIAPDESLVIDFEFDSKGMLGWQMKLLELYFADKDTPVKIYIDAKVE